MKKLAIIFILFFVQNFYSQEANIKHVVGNGETLSSIAQKYKVTPYDIVKLNPSAVNGLKDKDILIIPKSLVISTPVPTQNAAASTPTSSIQSQPNAENRIHIVQSKETKFGLSKLYGVTIQELEAQNPQIVAGLQVGHKLQIKGSTTGYSQDLSKANASLSFDSKFDYVVLPGETLYGISKRNGITVDELTKANASVLNGVLKSGQKLTIPTRKGNVIPASSVTVASDSKYHLVEPKETKFGLAKKYGVTIAELENLNPHIVKGLQIGQKISIPASYKGDDTLVAVSPKIIEVVDNKPTTNENKPTSNESKPEVKNQPVVNREYVDYEIQPKETLFGLSKKAGMSVKEFTDLNPKLADAVQIGMIIKMPKNASAIVNTITENSKPVASNKSDAIASTPTNSSAVKPISNFKNLAMTADKSVKKQVAILMPFDEAKFKEYASSSSDFKEVKDEFVKGNLQFYSGALKAIDSVKALGFALDTKLIEFHSNPDDLSLNKLDQNEDVSKSNLVLMPYFENEASKLASDFSKQNLPIVTTSLVGEDKGNANLYIAIPSESDIRNEVLDYLKTKNANVIVVNSATRVESRNDILNKFPDAKFVKVSDKNAVDTDDLKTLLVKNKLNYVILDTEKNSMIISSTNVLLSESTDFQIQMVVLEPSLLSNYTTISSIRINILKMIYPSYLSVDMAAKSSEIIKKSNKNAIEDDKNFLIGFDVTFDSLLRILQSKSFESTAEEEATQYVKLKFKYSKNVIGTHINKGFYILQHDTDNIIKEIKAN